MDVCRDDLSQKVLCDFFAGTGIVGRAFKNKAKQLIEELTTLKCISRFIAQEYGAGGKAKGSYFTQENAQKIDAIRQQIETWNNKRKISSDQHYFLLASLIESADKVANTTSVY